jgi:hypothetical protein
MDTPRFLVTALVGMAGAAATLVLAELLDAPWLRVVGIAFLFAVFIAREVWTWWGAGRQWLAMVGAVVGVMVLAFLVQRVAG